MTTGNASLIAALRERIGRQGPIPFAEFMHTALYEPVLGYYCQERMTTGPEGDFYTTPDASAAFGLLLARQVAEIAARTGCDEGPFHLIEAGPGTGRLARDLALGLTAEYPDLAARTVLTLVEISPSLQRAQRLTLQCAGTGLQDVRWASWSDVIEGRLEAAGGPFNGCVIANEFLDALPAHLVQRMGEQLREVRVGWGDGRFVEDLETPAPVRLQEHFDRLEREAGVVLDDGQRAEAGLAALDWVSSLGALFGAAGRGGALIVDYGHEARELYSSARHRGTLLCYHRHQALDDPLDLVGEQDMTAHVDFSSVMARARAAGFDAAGPVTQMKFLVVLGLADLLAEAGRTSGAAGARARLGMHQIMAPGGMGDVFKVVLLARGAAAGRLTGAKDPFRGPVEAAALPGVRAGEMTWTQ